MVENLWFKAINGKILLQSNNIMFVIGLIQWIH